MTIWSDYLEQRNAIWDRLAAERYGARSWDQLPMSLLKTFLTDILEAERLLSRLGEADYDAD